MSGMKANSMALVEKSMFVCSPKFDKGKRGGGSALKP